MSTLRTVVVMIPDMLVGLPDVDGNLFREIVYLYGRLLDQDIMLTLGVIVRELGPGIFEQISGHIIDRAIITYRSVLAALINDRIPELSISSTHHQPAEIHQSATEQLSAPLPSTPSLPDGLVTINEVAAYLRVTRTTVERLIKRGSLEGTHVGRKHYVTRKSIDKYLAVST